MNARTMMKLSVSFKFYNHFFDNLLIHVLDKLGQSQRLIKLGPDEVAAPQTYLQYAKDGCYICGDYSI